MGAIEDGVVHGFLPETEGFAVHYPAYPSSTARAIETLGGIDEIVRRRSSKNGYLELRFRPEDPNCHPAFGDLRRSSGLLLKITKNKGCPAGEKVHPCGEEPAAGSTQLCADVVARVGQAYHFEGMTDYQYVLPVHAAKSRKKKRGRLDAELRFENDRLLDLENDEVMMLVPPLFSLKDIPEQILLKPAPNLVSKQLQKGVVEQRWEMDMEPCLALPFNIEKIPGKVDWESHISRDSMEWQCQSAVSRLFDERPVWPRNSLNERLVNDGQQVSNHQMRRLLARAGCYFATGPFGKFWIRKGYDPRKDPESKIYQRVDFRVPEQLRKVFISGAKHRPTPKWKDLCSFQALPTKSFTSLQFYELEDDYIQQEMTKPAQKKSCTHSTGWLSKHVHEILSLHVRVRFLSIFDNDAARNLLKSTHKQLEKNKRLLLMGDVESNEDDSDTDNGHRETRSSNLQGRFQEGDEPEPYSEVENNEAINQSSLHPVRDGEDGSDNPEVEDEENEEGPDEYGLLSLGGSDPGFTLNPRSYGHGEDISVDYLQDILSGFRSKDNMGKARETDTSDGEYQIYEQESDGDSSE